MKIHFDENQLQEFLKQTFIECLRAEDPEWIQTIRESVLQQSQAESVSEPETETCFDEGIGFDDVLLAEDDLDTGNEELSPVVGLIEDLIREARQKRASSIHFHPESSSTHVFFRVDGMLQPVQTISSNLHRPLTARLKILGMLDIAERRIPQTGHFNCVKDGIETTLIVSTIPTSHGERICLKFTEPSVPGPMLLQELGLTEEQQRLLCREFRKKTGMILAIGPGNSGKSTLLKCLLNTENTKNVHVMLLDPAITSDDPLISRIDTSYRTGFPVSSGIRHAVFQEAEVIAAEITDYETLDQLVKASFRGVSILSSLHVSDAASAIFRFHAMGLPAQETAHVLNCLVSCRTIRKICPYCVTEYEATLREKTLLGLEKEHSVFRLKKGTGCSQCLQTGYFGIAGVYEVVPVDESLRMLIMKDYSGSDIRAYIDSQGLTLAESMKEKVISGLTTVDEFIRIRY